MTIEAQYTALTTGAGLLDRSSVDRLELTGEDRQRFLNGQVTCEVKDLTPGSLVYGFFTDRQGKIQADVTVLAFDDRLWLELPPDCGDAIREHLEKYILADRVAVAPLTSETPWTVVGPQAMETLETQGISGLPIEDGRHTEVELHGVPVCAARQPLYTLPAITFWLPTGRVADVIGRWEQQGLIPVGSGALDAVRVERGAPCFGIDFGPDNFPQETGLDHAVSYTKGCYLGQEVVARIHYRGGVNRHLRGLVFEGEWGEGKELPTPGTDLLAEGRPAGKLGTVVCSPALGAVAGLAILHKRVEPGGTVEVEGGGSAPKWAATVRELPLVPAV